jgi:hypothetical protein
MGAPAIPQHAPHVSAAGLRSLFGGPSNMNAIGGHCNCIGPNAALRNRRAKILGVVRGKRADDSPYIETDDTEFE